MYHQYAVVLRGFDQPMENEPNRHRGYEESDDAGDRCGLTAGSLLAGPAAQRGLQVRPRRRRTRPEDQMYSQPLPAVVG